MTKEEAIKVIMGVMNNYHIDSMINRKTDEALSVAIQALKAEPVVYCKDCIHLHDHDCPIDWGKTDDDYCSFGERKDEVEE